jgi:hypothetical protein
LHKLPINAAFVLGKLLFFSTLIKIFNECKIGAPTLSTMTLSLTLSLNDIQHK